MSIHAEYIPDRITGAYEVTLPYSFTRREGAKIVLTLNRTEAETLANELDHALSNLDPTSTARWVWSVEEGEEEVHNRLCPHTLRARGAHA